MKKSYLIFIFLLMILFSKSSSAQITINSTDMPSSNDTFRVSMGIAFTGMDETATGANYTWDYSQLTAASQTIDTFVSILSTGLYAIYFSGSSYAEKSNTPSFSLGIVTIDYQYDFYKKSSSAYVSNGVGANIGGFPVGVVNSPKDTLYRFPLNYNNHGSCYSAFATTIPGLGYYGGEKTRVDTVDGWGTLTTPYGTFPALRVKSVINETDTIYSETLGFGFPVPRPEVTEYKWLATAKGIPLLQVNATGGFVTQIIYRDSIRFNPVGIAEMEKKNFDFNIFPNPASDKLVIEYKLDHASNVSADIFNLNGKKIVSEFRDSKQTGKQFLPINLFDNISSGTYILQINVDGKSFQKQFVVRK
jgi:hypothetical protein